MRKSLLLGFGSLVAVAVLAAEVVISSLNPNGELTWTNSVSNATYRVEWGGSSTGPWNRMEALTNLSFVSGTIACLHLIPLVPGSTQGSGSLGQRQQDN